MTAHTLGFLGKEDIDLFHKQGFVLKRQCISTLEMDQLRTTLTAIIYNSLQDISQNPSYEPSDNEQSYFINGCRIVFKKRSNNSISIQKFNGCCGINPALLEVVRSKKLVTTFCELLGTRDLEHIISQIHPKLPGDGIFYPRHRDIQFRKAYDPDWKDILGNGSYGICIIPVDPMSPENGGLWVDRNNFPEEGKGEGEKENREWITAQPGDLLFMHPQLFHGSESNTSNVSRITLLTGFCAYGANSKPYPGALVNYRVQLAEDGTLTCVPTPWCQNYVGNLTIGH